jgi:sodium-coupled neutral amino acid transporter 11
MSISESDSSSIRSPFHVQSEVGHEDHQESLITHNIEEFFCFCIPWNWIVLPKGGKEVKIKNSDLSTMFLILNTMIGSGILVQPYVFQQSGIVATIFEYIIFCYMIFTGAELMVLCGNKVGIYDFSEVVHNIIGEWGMFIVDVAIVFIGAGSLLSYIIIIGSLFSSMVGSGSCSSSSGWYCNEGFLTVLPILFFTVPLCLIRKFGHLAYISYASIFVITSVILLVLIGGPIRKEYYSDDNNSVQTGNFLGCIRSMGDIVFALGYITAIFHAYRAHGNQDIAAYNALTFKTTIIGAVMCFITGLAGYLSFVDNTETNILFNFPGPVGDVFKMMVIIHLLLYIPGDFVILRFSLLKLFKVDAEKQSDTHFVLVTLACILFLTGIAIILLLTLGDNESLGIVVNLTGGISGSVLYFIVPGLCATKVFPDDLKIYRKGSVMIVFGIIIFLLVFISTFI